MRLPAGAGDDAATDEELAHLCEPGPAAAGRASAGAADDGEAAGGCCGGCCGAGCGGWACALVDRGSAAPLRARSRDGSPHATDEVFNSVSHFLGFLLSVVCGAMLVSKASVQGEPWSIVGVSVYSAALCFLFACSTLHHAVDATPQCEAALRMLDYIAIFPLIAGTLTPLALTCAHDTFQGWALFGSSWLICVCGIVLLCVLGLDRVPMWMTMTLYLAMGWCCVIIMPQAVQCIGYGGLALIVAGGALYSMGSLIFVIQKPNPFPGVFGFHEIWHIFVLLAAACHWMCMYYFLL